MFCKNTLSTGSHLWCKWFSCLPKFSQLSPHFKDNLENIWRPTFFCQVTRFCVSWQLSFTGSPNFLNMTKSLELKLLVIRKISCLSDANKFSKMKHWWLKKSNFFANTKVTLVFVVVWTGLKSQINSYLSNTRLIDYWYIQYSIFEAHFIVNHSDWLTFSILFSNSSFLASVVLWSATF